MARAPIRFWRLLIAFLSGFRRFQTRLLVFVLGLMLVVQVAVFWAVNTANLRNARVNIDEALALTASVLNNTLDIRNQRLLEKVRALSSDFAFKRAYSTSEHGTILSALVSHQSRVDADLMMALTMEGKVVADTLHPSAHGGEFTLPGLLRAAHNSKHGEASTIALLEGKAYQLVMVPLFAPRPTAWMVIGFLIDDELARTIGENTHSEVTLIRTGQPRTEVLSSTLAPPLRTQLDQQISRGLGQLLRDDTITLGGNIYVSLLTQPPNQTQTRVHALLQRSLDRTLEPYLRLQNRLILIFVLGIGISGLGAVIIAQRVTRPVKSLARGAQHIAEGDYNQTINVAQRDELGELAGLFNQMTKGLAERNRVRNLLGKVVSPAIAEELLSKEIKLGGEQREVTIVFSDIRNFTRLCEDKEPASILRLINRYLTELSGVIEQHGGVVDKYIGDAIMALFGAPLVHGDDAARAIAACLAMQAAVRRLQQHTGGAGLTMGIGVNTDTVVAGNMGSENRLNYTVIGDGVNLASRLEGLTKQYGVPIIASEFTREQAPDFAYRELDRTRVKGRQQPVRIYEPIAAIDELTPATERWLEAHHAALTLYYHGDWQGALRGFEQLANQWPDDQTARLYCQRVQYFRAHPPGAGWDGTFTFEQK